MPYGVMQFRHAQLLLSFKNLLTHALKLAIPSLVGIQFCGVMIIQIRE